MGYRVVTVTRRLTKLAVFLLLGAIVNVAVAWGLAIRPESRAPHRDSTLVGFDSYRWNEPYRPNQFKTRVWYRIGAFRFTQEVRSIRTSRRAVRPIEETEYRKLVPDWSEFASGEPIARYPQVFDARKNPVRYVEFVSGWPSYALRYYGPVFPPIPGSSGVPDYLYVNGYLQIVLPKPMIRKRYSNKLPFYPLWPGFLTNTIFYAAIVWMLWSSPFVVRHVIRRKRGRCTRCGYDLRGTSGGASGGGGGGVCPECGATTR